LGNLINWELISNPINWVIVFLIAYFLALATMYVATNLNSAGISL